MADVSGSLGAYLASLRHLRWKPGVLDCGIFMANWMVSRGARDPIADIRGAYASERQFLRIIRREGGFLRCCAARLERIGMVETESARPGDLLAVMAPYAERRGKVQRRPTGAIAVDDGERAVVTSDMGIVIAGADALPALQVWTWNG
ncbi:MULTISPECIES: DUF6950 family protein [unclassified Bradyrhizobium]